MAQTWQGCRSPGPTAIRGGTTGGDRAYRGTHATRRRRIHSNRRHELAGCLQRPFVRRKTNAQRPTLVRGLGRAPAKRRAVQEMGPGATSCAHSRRCHARSTPPSSTARTGTPSTRIRCMRPVGVTSALLSRMPSRPRRPAGPCYARPPLYRRGLPPTLSCLRRQVAPCERLLVSTA